MNGLQDDELRTLRELLDHQRSNLEQRLSAIRTETQPVGLDLPIGRLSRMDAIQQQSMASGQRGRIEQDLQKVRAALLRLEQRTYGACLRCHESISYERLRIQPVAPLCFACQEDLEKTRG